MYKFEVNLIIINEFEFRGKLNKIIIKYFKNFYKINL